MITGASGFVGSRLLRELCVGEFDVRALVRRQRSWLVADQMVGDLMEDGTAEAACEGVDAVIHLAGANEVEAGRDPDGALTGIVVGTRRLAHAAAVAGVRTFVYLSTVHVYGAALEAGAQITESTVPRPHAVYGIARLAAEHLAQSVADTDVVVLRLTNAIGAPAHPRVDRWTLVANDLCKQAALNGILELKTDGTQWRDFTSLKEVCGLLAEAARGRLPAGTYNAGSGVPMTIRGLAERIQDLAEARTGRRPELQAPEPKQPPAAPYVVSVRRLAETGHKLPENVDEAIDETLRFCLERRDELCR